MKDPLRRYVKHSDETDIIETKSYNTVLEDPLKGVEYHRDDGSWIARKASVYVRRILHALNKELIKQGGIKLRYRDLRIEAMRDPPFVVNEDNTRSYVLGYYNTRNKTLYLNPLLTEDMVKKVTAHEIVHYMQDKLGIIGNYVEKYGERGARQRLESMDHHITKGVMDDLYYLDRIQPVNSATA